MKYLDVYAYAKEMLEECYPLPISIADVESFFVKNLSNAYKEALREDLSNCVDNF